MSFGASLLYASRLIFSSKRSNGRKSLIGAMICIGLSLIPLIAVLCVSDGMVKGITGRIIGLSTQDIHITLDSENYSLDTMDSFVGYSRGIGRIDGVKNVYPEINNTVLASANGYRIGATLRAVENDIFNSNESFKNLFSVIEGDTAFSNDRSVILCQKIANDLNLHAGDRITLISANKVKRNTIIPKTGVFTVQGIVSCGYQELDAIWIFTPLSTGFSFLPKVSSQYVIKVQTEDSFSPNLIKVKHDVMAYDDSSDVFTWNEMNKAQFENFASTKLLLLLIMLLIVLVASVNISSALIMIVLERRKEIAILKSIGGTGGGISFSFLIMGLISGIGGLVFGIPIGLFAAVNINSIIAFSEKTINFFIRISYIVSNKDMSAYNTVHLLDPAYYLQNIPVAIPFKDVSLIAFGTIVLSLFASIMPSIKAGKEKPLDTLRKL